MFKNKFLFWNTHSCPVTVTALHCSYTPIISCISFKIKALVSFGRNSHFLTGRLLWYNYQQNARWRLCLHNNDFTDNAKPFIYIKMSVFWLNINNFKNAELEPWSVIIVELWLSPTILTEMSHTVHFGSNKNQLYWYCAVVGNCPETLKCCHPL